MTHRIAGIALASALLASCSAGDNEAANPSPADPSSAIDVVAAARSCNTAEDDAIPMSETPGGHDLSSADNLIAAQAYLEDARMANCVYELPSGLLFRIRQSAGDAPSPTAGDLVTVHYRGMFTDGNEFDSSYSRGEPATFPSDRLIAGWVEALPLMRVGEHWELYITPELGYGERGTPGGPIAPNQALVFELELIDLPGLAAEEQN
jgi:FKBP-type peptidyl-prolyl cis-trans isomerase FklB